MTIFQLSRGLHFCKDHYRGRLNLKREAGGRVSNDHESLSRWERAVHTSKTLKKSKLLGSGGPPSCLGWPQGVREQRYGSVFDTVNYDFERSLGKVAPRASNGDFEPASYRIYSTEPQTCRYGKRNGNRSSPRNVVKLQAPSVGCVDVMLEGQAGVDSR